MFRVGISFIFSRIKSRSASVTLNLICTVLFRPSMFSLLSVPRVWDTSQQAIFNRRAAAREGENTEVGTRFLCLLRKFFLTSYYGAIPDFAKLPQKKNAAIFQRLQRFLNPIQFCRTHLIRPLFRLLQSLSPLRSQSVCLYRSYHQGARQAAAAACFSLAAYLKGIGLRIYCNGA